MTGNIIDNYAEMAQSIDNVIQKKQAMILIENAEEGYKTATQNYTEAIKSQEAAYAQLVDKVAAFNEKFEGLNLTVEDVANGKTLEVVREWANGFDDANARVSKLSLAMSEASKNLNVYGDIYAEASDTVQEYSSDIQKYNDAVVASSEERYADVAKILDSENTMYANAADVAAQASGKSVKELSDNLKTALLNVQNAQNNLQKNNNEYNRAALKGAQETATGIFDAYLAAGGNAGQAVKQGLVDSEDEFYQITSQLGVEGAKQISDKYQDFYTSGGYTVDGIVKGAQDNSDKVRVTYAELGRQANLAFNTACLIKSPSRKFIKSSYWNVMGLVKGVETYKGKFTTVMKELAHAGIQAFSFEDYRTVAKKYLDKVLDSFKETKTNVQKVEAEKNKVLLESEKKYNEEKAKLDAKRDEEEYQERLKNAKTKEARAKVIAEREKEIREKAEDEAIESLKKQAEYEREIYEATQKDVEIAKNNILTSFKEIAEEAFDDIESVYENVNKMRQRLSKTNIVRNVKFDFGDKEESYTLLSDLSKQRDRLIEFGKALDKLKSMGNIPKEIIEEIASKDVAEGLNAANAFINASPFGLEQWLKDYNTIKSESARISSEYYKDDIENVVDEVTKTFDKTPEEFFEIGKDSVEQFGKGFMDNLASVWATIQSSIAVMIQQSFPEMFGGGGTEVTTNYNLTVNGDSSSDGQGLINKWANWVTYDQHMQKRGAT